MISILITLGTLYAFAALGYSAKRIFKERMDTETLTLLSIYYFQPILAFWGLLRRPLDGTFVEAGLFFVAATLLVFVLTFVVGSVTMREPKKRSILITAGLFGNTGNLGITVVLVTLGEEYVPYASLMNMVNLMVFSTLGAFFYSRGSFSVADSIRNVMKLPAIWAGVIALLLNGFSVPIPEAIDRAFEIGAYASICVQLLVFGMYLSEIHLRRLHGWLIGWVSFIKLIALPVTGWMLLKIFPASTVIIAPVILQLMTPLAVNNINFAALYDCEPETVAELTFATSILFFVALPILVPILGIS